MSNKLYDNYHRQLVKTSVQHRLIDSKNFTYINFHRYILPAIKKVSPINILDIGSGAGTLSLYLANLGFKVVGVDISSIAIKQSKLSSEYLGLKRNVVYKNCDVLDFVHEKKFDLVLCLEVIEHIHDADKLVRKISKLLTRTGTIILSTPLDTAPLTRLGKTQEFDISVGHLRRYSKQSVFSLLHLNKFTISEFIETEGILRNALFVFPVLNNMLRYIRGPLVTMITILDDLLGKLFGYSDLIVIATKK